MADVGLFQYFSWAMEEIIKQRGGPHAEAFEQVYVLGVLSNPVVTHIDNRALSLGRVQLGRMDYDKIIKFLPSKLIFVVGGQGLQEAVSHTYAKPLTAFAIREPHSTV
eukprot:12748336-Heterocapsa_arctica.AAC.1